MLPPILFNSSNSSSQPSPLPLEEACRELWIWSDPACDIPRPVEDDPPVSQFEVLRDGHPFFSRPNWRWRLACHILYRRREPDPWLRRARRISGRLAGKNRLRKDPEVLAAYQLSRLPELPLGELQARILANEEQTTLARRCGVSVGAIEAYEAIFWDVRRRLECAPWIRNVAVREPPTGVWPDQPVGPWLKYAGSTLGVLGLEPLLIALQRSVQTPLSMSSCLLATSPLPVSFKAWVAALMLPVPETVREYIRLQRFLRLDDDQNRTRRRFRKLPTGWTEQEIVRSQPRIDCPLAVRATVEQLPPSVRARLGWRTPEDLDKIVNLSELQATKAD